MHFKTNIVRTSRVAVDARLKQAQGIFDLPPAAEQTLTWPIDITLPEHWSVGAIVGESGSGKTTIARELAAVLGGTVIESKDSEGNLREPFDWKRDKAVASATCLPIKEWTGLLSRVGFSSPPAWCRPYQVLSNGQQFRANLARAIAEAGDKPVFFDEFASLVHDQVAKIASAAVAKGVRAMNRQLVAVTWRTDILDSLEPDWVIFCNSDQTVRLELNTSDREGVRRWSRKSPQIRVVRTDTAAWNVFKGHHYLTANHKAQAICFVGYVGRQPAAFCSVIHFPSQQGGFWKEHRTVVLPDYQGVGIGNALSEYVASLLVATGKPYRDRTGHPGHIYHRIRSPLWKQCTRMGIMSMLSSKSLSQFRSTASTDRLTMSFEYIGPARSEDARRFGVLKG